MCSVVGVVIPGFVCSSIGRKCSRTAQASPRSVVMVVPPMSMGSSRRMTVVSRAGPPSTSSYVFAFAMPMALLIGTIFTAMRVGDKLDQRYLEELEINEAIRAADEDDDTDEDEGVDDGAATVPLPEERPQRQRPRNRPIRKT